MYALNDFGNHSTPVGECAMLFGTVEPVFE